MIKSAFIIIALVCIKILYKYVCINAENTSKPLLLPIPVEGAFDQVAVDCLGPFPESYSGNRYVVVFSTI